MSWRRISSKPPGDAAASILRRCALVVLVVALMVVVSYSAHASCGDYVLVRDASGKLVPASQAAAGELRAAEHSSDPMQRPCRGPKCSRLPTRPPAVPPVTIHYSSSPEAVLAEVSDGADRPESDRPPASSGPLHPVHDSGGIFRPPR